MKEIVLLAENDPVIADITTTILKHHEYHVEHVANGKEALNYLKTPHNHADIILMDDDMPIMDGLTFMQAYKQESIRHAPVIMVISSEASEHIEKAINAGIYYHINKPIQEGVLLSLIENALESNALHEELRDIATQQHDIQSMLRDIHLQGRTFGEMRSMSRFLAGFYPEPQNAIIGIYELLINAVEHGNLDIRFEDKKTLLSNMTWEDEIHARQTTAPYKDRMVDVHFSVTKEGITLTIRDEGDGFQADHFLHQVARAPNESHGRGILMAKEISFDKVQYLGKGNQVTCYKQNRGER